MPAAEVHHGTLVIFAVSTAHVLAITNMRARMARRGWPLGRTLLTGNPHRMGRPPSAPPWC